MTTNLIVCVLLYLHMVMYTLQGNMRYRVVPIKNRLVATRTGRPSDPLKQTGPDRCAVTSLTWNTHLHNEYSNYARLFS